VLTRSNEIGGKGFPALGACVRTGVDMAAPIKQWAEIREEFRDSLLVGNGASIAVFEGFRYDNLFEKACESKILDDNTVAIFKAFGEDQTDFEVVLRRLWYARQVNLALKLQGDAVERVDSLYSAVRHALIEAVRRVHVEPATAREHFDAIARFTGSFRTVFSLNYDLLLYWATNYGRAEGLGDFRDCFGRSNAGLTFDPNWARAENNGHFTRCFYPHGALMFARTDYGGETKLTVREGGGLLLDKIGESWSEHATPLFVCEGKSAHKLQSIASSAYLAQVYSAGFDQIRASLTIYGWSMSPQDQHIVDRIVQVKPNAIAVSVRNGNKKTIDRACDLFGPHVPRLEFFDAESPGAWNVSDGTKEREEKEMNERLLRLMEQLNQREQR
jgi:hypothetical protein